MEGELLMNLCEYLDAISLDGHFSSFHVYESYVNPGLDVRGYGKVGLPLSSRDADAITRLCKPSPFGKGDQTLVDDSVRKCWELDATEFECRNPAWHSYLLKLVRTATKALGVEVSSEARRYKLLLYEEGAFFKAHKDSEKEPGMYGTLVICLPSEHTGGDVHLKHGNQEEILSTSANSAYDMTTLAWYSDVSHEVRPVTSGYRCVLTYNLLQDEMHARRSATQLDETNESLAQMLKAWNKDLPHRDKLIYPLDHQYTVSGLSLRGLKGRDAAVAQLLDRLCTPNGVFMFLAQITKHHTYEDYSDDDEEEEGLVIDHMVTSSGAKLELDIEICEDDFVMDGDEYYESRSPDSEDEEEFTGNESMPAKSRYHDTVIILMRTKSVLSRLSLGGDTPETLSAYFHLLRNDRDNTSQENPATHFDKLTHMMVAALKGLSEVENSHMDRLSNARAAHHQSYENIFTDIAQYCYDQEHPEVVRGALRKIMQNMGWGRNRAFVSLLQLHMARARAPVDPDDAGFWAHWLSIPEECVRSFSYANDMKNSFQALRARLPATDIPSFDRWTKSHLEAVLGSVTGWVEADVPALKALLCSLPQETLTTIILPVVIQYPHRDGTFLLLSEIGSKTPADMPTTTVNLVYKAILGAPIPIIRLTTEELFREGTHHATSKKAVFLDIFERAFQIGLHDEAARLLRHGLPTAPEPESKLWKVWENVTTFLDRLTNMLANPAYTQTYEAAQDAIISLLGTMTRAITNRRPTVPKDWRRTREWEHSFCTVDACKEVSRFLANPDRMQQGFKHAEAIRKHIQYSLPHVGYRFYTEKNKGAPHTLIITKTMDAHADQRVQWEKDVKKLQEELDRFCREPSNVVIGAKVAELLEFKRILQAARASAANPEANPLQPQSRSTQNARAPQQFAGQKRKVDVVDLT